MFEYTTRIAALAGVMACLASPVQAQAEPPASSADPDQQELARKHYELAETYKARKQYSKAVTEYLQAFELVPRSSLLFNVAQAYWLAGDHENALNYYGRYLEREPDGPGARVAREQHFNAAEIAWQSGRRDRALDWYARYLELDPGGMYTETARGRFFQAAEKDWQVGDIDRALQGYRRYLELAPDGPGAEMARERHFQAAERHDREGERDRALEHYERYLELAPGGASAGAARERIAAIRAMEREPAQGRPRDRVEPGPTAEVAAGPIREAAPLRWSGVVHAALDYKARGAAAVAGVGLGVGRGIEVRAAGVVGPTLGAYVGGVAHIGRLGAVEPVAGVGVPVFFEDGVRLGIRGSLGVEWAAMERMSALVEVAAEHYFNAQWNRAATVLVPLVGVRARL